jgi:hypothetical protein
MTTPCSPCHGTGKITLFQLPEECPACHGTGLAPAPQFSPGAETPPNVKMERCTFHYSVPPPRFQPSEFTLGIEGLDCDGLPVALTVTQGKRVIRCVREPEKPVAKEPPCRPTAITFFATGVAMVCDQDGQQMPQYQVGGTGDSLAALASDGIDWTTLKHQGNPVDVAGNIGCEWYARPPYVPESSQP